MFKTERLLIRLSAIFGIVGIVMIAALFAMMNYMKNSPEMRKAIEASGRQVENNYFTTTYYITTILSIIVVIALFIAANQLNEDNYKPVGISLIILGIVSYPLLWFVPLILMIIAGVLILRHKRVPQDVEIFEDPA